MAQLTRRGFLTGAAVAAGAWALDAPGIGWAGSAARPPALRSPDVSIGWTRIVYDRVKAERVLPPAAARAYAYIALAGYEAVVGGMPRHRSLGGQLNDFPVLPTASGLDWEIAMNEAINVVARAVFADRSLATMAAIDEHYSATAMALANGAPQGLRTRSVGHGRAVGERGRRPRGSRPLRRDARTPVHTCDRTRQVDRDAAQLRRCDRAPLGRTGVVHAGRQRRMPTAAPVAVLGSTGIGLLDAGTDRARHGRRPDRRTAGDGTVLAR